MLYFGRSYFCFYYLKTRRKQSVSKIGQDLIARCSGAACCANEFVVLPPDGDAGFEEYFGLKADGVYDARHLFVRKKEQTRLILKYPSPSSENPDNDLLLLHRFFTSPEAAACNQPFEGCFGIDVTAYLRKTADPRLDQLISYIRTHTDIVFVLFAYAGDAKQALPLLGAFDQYFPLQMLRIPLPDAEMLTVYTEGLIRERYPEYNGSLRDDIKAFFTEEPTGYDTAEFLLRELEERGFRGEKEILTNSIRYMKSCSKQGRSSFGY